MLIPAIRGTTRLVGVFGWPVSHSRSPMMQTAALVAAGIDALYVPFPVEPSRVGDAVRGLRALGIVGCNVTIPHKEAVIPFLDLLTPEAEAIGAVNTIRVEENGALVGHNTDCVGALGAMERDGTSVRGKVIAVLGAGGAARGAAAGCAFAGAARVLVLNRTLSRAETLVGDLSARLASSGTRFDAFPLDEGRHPQAIDWSAVEAVFQMSSAGMGGEGEPPMDLGLLPSGCHVLDTVYAPPETPFLRAARAKGLRCTDGLAMLLEQGAASFEFWFGTAPDRDAMRRALDEQSER